MGEALQNQMMTIVLLTIIGVVLQRIGLFNQEVQKALSTFIISVLIPATIISSANRPYEVSALKAAGILFIGSIVYHIVTDIFGRGVVAFLPLSTDKKDIFRLLVTYTNVAFIGYPIIAIFLPAQGAFYAAFFIVGFNIMFYTYGVAQMGAQITLKSILLRPPVVASLLMLILYLTQISLPVPVNNTLELLGSMSTPLSILIVGSMIGGKSLKDLLFTPSIYLSSALRLMVVPTLVFLLLRQLPLPIDIKTLFLVMSALPPGNSIAVAGEFYNKEAEYAALGVLHGTLFFTFTVYYLNFLVARL